MKADDKCKNSIFQPLPWETHTPAKVLSSMASGSCANASFKVLFMELQCLSLALADLSTSHLLIAIGLQWQPQHPLFVSQQPEWANPRPHGVQN